MNSLPRFSSSLPVLLLGFALLLPLPGQAKVASVELDCVGITSGEVQGLAGSWSFQWMQFEEVPTWNDGAVAHERIKVPATWIVSETASKLPYPHFGHATYTIELRLDRDCPQEMGIDFKAVRSSLNAFLVWPDGKTLKIGTMGKFSDDPNSGIHQHRRSIYAFQHRGFDRVQLVAQISKYDGGEGGLNRAPVVGELQELSARKQMDAQREFFVVGTLVFVAFYHFLLFFSRRTDLSSLYFALICLVMTIRFFVVGGFLDLWFNEPMESLYQAKVQIDYFTYALVLLVCYRYIDTLFSETMWKPWMRFLTIATLFLVVWTPIGSALDISLRYKYVHLVFAGTSLATIWGLYGAIRIKKKGAKRLSVGIVAIIAAGINDALAGADVVANPMLSPLAIIVFIYINARIIAERHSEALSTAEHLTANLETEVEKKTEALESRTWEAEQAQAAALAAQDKLELVNRDITENVLKRYLPPRLIDEILAGDRTMNDSPKHLDVTIIFTDLVGFTSLSEQIGTQTVARLLNEYFTAMGDVIFDNGGTIDKFIGDAIMVLFGAPVESTPKVQAHQAAATAREMLAQLRILNKKWNEEGLPSLSMRIGIHRGPALVGNLGSDRRIDYTAIGGTVNRASRIETVCTPGCVYMSREVASLLPEDMHVAAGEFNLKGFHDTVTLYQLKRSNIIEFDISKKKQSVK